MGGGRGNLRDEVVDPAALLQASQGDVGVVWLYTGKGVPASKATGPVPGPRARGTHELQGAGIINCDKQQTLTGPCSQG